MEKLNEDNKEASNYISDGLIGTEESNNEYSRIQVSSPEEKGADSKLKIESLPEKNLDSIKEVFSNTAVPTFKFYHSLSS